MSVLKDYQMAFTHHIRDPENTLPPHGVSERGMAVYTEIVFNNIESSVAASFPVLKKVLGDDIWLRLVREFFIHQPCKTPIFREIPEVFLAYINRVSGLPPYVQNLAHYEWVELYLAYADEIIHWSQIDAEADLLDAPLAFVPAIALLSYDYPVHQISPDNIPVSPLETPVNLLVFRDTEDAVKFIELNQMTAALIEDLQDGQLTARQSLIGIASVLEFEDADAIVDFGLEVLQDLKSQGAVLGVLNTNPD
jgi:uncharacterized protein